jgi:hypothetical protein
MVRQQGATVMGFTAHSLFEVVGQAARSHREKPRKTTSAKKAHGIKGFMAISEKDQLFFQSVASSTQQSSLPETQTAKVNFHKAFCEVWANIPEYDRRQLVNYWHTQPSLSSGVANVPRPSHRPLIQVIDDEPWIPGYQVCKHSGAMLTFPISLVMDHPGRLALEIARTLAHVHRMATRQHWRLVQTIIEEPMVRWEKRQGIKLTDDARDRKLDKLEAVFVKESETAVAELLDRWRLRPLPSTERRKACERETNEG